MRARRRLPHSVAPQYTRLSGNSLPNWRLRGARAPPSAAKGRVFVGKWARGIAGATEGMGAMGGATGMDRTEGYMLGMFLKGVALDDIRSCSSKALGAELTP